MDDVVSVPKALLEELYVHFMKIEEILATLEELMDKEGLERIKRGLEEYKKDEYVVAESEKDIENILMKD